MEGILTGTTTLGQSGLGSNERKSENMKEDEKKK